MCRDPRPECLLRLRQTSIPQRDVTDPQLEPLFGHTPHEDPFSTYKSYDGYDAEPY